MKKLIAWLGVVWMGSTAWALPVGNPGEASLFSKSAFWKSTYFNPSQSCYTWFDAWSLRVGFYGDYVFNRHLEVNESANYSDIDVATLFTNAGYLVLNIHNRLDVFGTLGATQLHMKTDATSFGSTVSRISEWGFATRFSWSAGVRGTLVQCRGLRIGVEGQYFQTTPRLDSYTSYDNGTITYFNEGNQTRYREWQVGLGVSYRFSTGCPSFALIPYVAADWSRAKWDFHDFVFTANGQTLTLDNLKSKKYWGYAIGTSFTMCETIGLAVEGRFANEKALSVLGEFRF